MTNDRQADPQTTMRPGRGAVRLTKAIEDEAKKFRRNSLSRVGDANLRHVNQSGPESRGLVPRGRKFHRVGQQIPNHLLQTVRVTVDLDVRCQFGKDARFPWHQRRGELRPPRPARSASASHLPQIQSHLSRRNARDVKQIFDQFGLRLDVTFDHVQPVASPVPAILPCARAPSSRRSRSAESATHAIRSPKIRPSADWLLAPVRRWHFEWQSKRSAPVAPEGIRPRW